MHDYTNFLYIFFIIIQSLALLLVARHLRERIENLSVDVAIKDRDIMDNILKLASVVDGNITLKGGLDERLRNLTAKQLDALKALNQKIKETQNTFATVSSDMWREIQKIKRELPNSKPQTSLLQEMPYNEEMQIDS